MRETNKRVSHCVSLCDNSTFKRIVFPHQNSSAFPLSSTPHLPPDFNLEKSYLLSTASILLSPPVVTATSTVGIKKDSLPGMADEAAEAAFLDAMRAQNDAAGGQEVYGTTSQQQTDSVSDDEYDPAAVMHAESLSTDAQDPAVPLSSTSASAVKPVISSAPQEPYLPTTASIPDDTEGSDQSRSMSPDSTESLSGVPPIISQPEGETTKEAPKPEGTTNGAEDGHGTITNGQPLNPASPTIPDTLPNSLPTEHVSIQNDVQGVPSAESFQNSVVPSVSDIPATTTNAEAVSDGKSVAEPSTSAAQSQLKAKAETLPATATTAPKARLPHDRIGILEDRIQVDPRGDLDAWLTLISEHRQRGKLNDARKVYERFFEFFPSAVR